MDVKYALRILWKDKGFTATAVLTLALCVGANAAIFAVVNSVLLRPLAAPEPERLVLMHNSYPRAGVERASNGVPDYFDRLRDVQALEEQALFNSRGVTIGFEGNPQRVSSMVARPSLLRLLRVNPYRGRLFTEDEGEMGRNQKTVLTYAFWQQYFGGSDAALGQSVRINGVPHEIIGVLPPDWFFLWPEVRLWTPLAFTEQEKSDDSRHSNNWSMIGRLKPGATIAQAQQQVDALNARNMERFPQFREILTNAGFHTVVKSLQEDVTEGVRRTLYLLWGGVLFVLLIGAVNITNLVLVRSTARMKELATRHALGAGLGRLMRQLLTETILLTAIGGVAGLMLGYWGVAVLRRAGLDQIPRGTEIGIDLSVVLFTLGLALVVGIVIGLVPLVNMRQVNLAQAFREEGRSGTSGRGARTVRRLLVTAQVAFAFMLLVGAGLLVASFQRVLAIDPGFDPDNVLTARVSTPASRYPDNPQLRAFAARLHERVRAVPGVLHAGITSNIPFGGDFSDSVIMAEGYQMAPGESVISPYRIAISPGYFDAMGIEVKAGRGFTDSDTENSPRVVIVDERLARKFWPNTNPLGRRMYLPDGAEDLIKPGPNVTWLTVIGIARETRTSGFVTRDDRVGTYYFPLAQAPRRVLTLALKVQGDATSITPALRRELAAIDPELPLYNVQTLRERMDESLVDRRTPMLLAMVFAGVALFLAAVGIYGVLAYQVTQRRREIGIRMALGSQPGNVFRLVLREGVVLLAIGFVLGLGGAFAIRKTMETQLYGVGPMDPIVVALVTGMLGAVALLACSIPARRASRIDPVIALSEP